MSDPAFVSVDHQQCHS